MRIEKDVWYRRGKDYPYYKNHCKMHLTMKGEEVLKWFTEEELTKEGYPKPNAYCGSLP